MKIDFFRVDNKTPFNCTVNDCLSNNKPSFWIHTDLGWNPKSKAAAKGFVFVEKEVSLEMTCRFIAKQCVVWPELAEKYKSFIGQLK